METTMKTMKQPLIKYFLAPSCLAAQDTGCVEFDDMSTEDTSATNLLKYELEVARKKVLELEKEKELIIMNSELLKTEVESSESSEKAHWFEMLSNHDVSSICSYYQERLSNLHGDIEHMRSRALYYKYEASFASADFLLFHDFNIFTDQFLEEKSAMLSTED
ncbi:unnamed protein product [Gongylonema pulchrum]|uniref:GTD-binding domain-containing protein n=1 Tax=Gongylonema pulchrum TaxID=637853 RepID=A0A183EHD1_9BILA|nr:unnamed protein product [Gongylonema pulchrum]